MRNLLLVSFFLLFLQTQAHASSCEGTFGKNDSFTRNLAEILESSDVPVSKIARSSTKEKTNTKTPSREEIFKRLKKSAEQGNPEAQVKLGTSYFYGEGGASRNHKKALEWYTKSAKQGNVHAQYNLSLIFLNGYGGVPINKKKALYWLEKASWQGHILAQEMIDEIKSGS